MSNYDSYLSSLLDYLKQYITNMKSRPILFIGLDHRVTALIRHISLNTDEMVVFLLPNRLVDPTNERFSTKYREQTR